MRLAHKIMGAAGEVYESMGPKDSRPNPAPPEVSVRDAEGVEMSRGSIEYG